MKMKRRRTDYDTLAGRYAEHRRIHPGVLRRLTQALEAEARVLEVGCGNGQYLWAVRDRVGCTCVGIDPSSGMLAKLREHGGAVSPVRAVAERLPFPAAVFDRVYFVDVIHHVSDRSLALGEAFRVLRPGRTLCVVTDSEWIIRHREPLAVYFPETVSRELARYPGLPELRTEIAGAGFEGLREETAEHAYDLTDSRAYRARVFSALRDLPDDVFERGLSRLEEDLGLGPVRCRAWYALLWAGKPLPR